MDRGAVRRRLVTKRRLEPPSTARRLAGESSLPGFRRCLAVTIAAVVCSAAAAGSAQKAVADDSFDALFRRGSEVNASLKTLTGRFTESTTSSLLTRPLIARGTVAVERPSRVILNYDEPEARVVLIDGDRLTVSWPGRHIKQVTNVASAQRRVQKYFVDSTPAELRSNFEIESRRAEDRPGTYRLTMVPKRKQIREGLTRLELWLDQSSLLLSAMRMTFPNGDTKLMVLTDVVANAPLDSTVFQIDP
jgi:outer membrane lipoprotein-sorting protein